MTQKTVPLTAERLTRLVGFYVSQSQVDQWEKDRLLGAERWRDRLSSNPLYAAKAKRSEELTGDPLNFYKNFYGSRPFMLPPLKESPTAKAKAETPE